jgi:hypothetical protein
MQTYWFENTLACPKKDQILGRVTSMTGSWFKSTLARPQWVGAFRILGKA